VRDLQLSVSFDTAGRIEKPEMKKIIDVQIGEVKVGGGGVVLQSKAIGSCIAIAAYDAAKGIGAMAHVMLPGSSPADKESCEKTKYAADAIDAMVGQMARLGSRNDDIEVAIVGGGNILNRKDDAICRENIESVVGLLRAKRLKISASAVGGTNRRSVSLDIDRGIALYAEGDGNEKQLWRVQKTAE
jgi:chemotaxis protein CheD